MVSYNQLKVEMLEERKLAASTEGEVKHYHKIRSGLLGALVADSVAIARKTENRDPTDQEIQKVASKFLASAEENLKSIESKDPGRVTEKRNIQIEIEFLKKYLPTLLTKGELEVIIENIIKNSPGAVLGKVMGELSKSYKGKYDGAMASAIVVLRLGR